MVSTESEQARRLRLSRPEAPAPRCRVHHGPGNLVDLPEGAARQAELRRVVAMLCKLR